MDGAVSDTTSFLQTSRSVFHLILAVHVETSTLKRCLNTNMAMLDPGGKLHQLAAGMNDET